MHNDLEDKKIIIKLDKPLRDSLAAQKNYLDKLRKIIKLLDNDSPLDEGGATHLYRLVLQHRLDKESVLNNLLRSNKQLCLALGLEEHGSLKHNIDMLITQLGTDNFSKELSLLGHMVAKLNKALALTEKTKLIQKKEKALFEGLLKKIKYLYPRKDPLTQVKALKSTVIDESMNHDARMRAYGDSIAEELRLAAGLQAYFSTSIALLSDAYHDMPGLPKFGIIYDYLVALQGPFLDMILMIKEGVSLTDTILLVLSHKLGIQPQKTVNELFHQTNLELEHFYQKQVALQHEYAVHKNDMELMSSQLSAQIDAIASVNVPPAPDLASGWKKKTLSLFNRT